MRLSEAVVAFVVALSVALPVPAPGATVAARTPACQAHKGRASGGLSRRQAAHQRPVVQRTEPREYEFYVPNHNGHPDPQSIALTIIGSRFSNGAVVLFNGKAVPTKFVSPARLTASVPFAWISKVPRSDPADPSDMQGTARLTVRNPGAKGLRSRPHAFRIVATPVGG